ncbi:hypothetical protein [Streptomyces plumbiresistens]|uniref:hypothetical protein n=1 Tax=Streptomyces plumbiresistens TaxID=511811 RepID=UPI0031F0FDF1
MLGADPYFSKGPYPVPQAMLSYRGTNTMDQRHLAELIVDRGGGHLGADRRRDTSHGRCCPMSLPI